VPTCQPRSSRPLREKKKEKKKKTVHITIRCISVALSSVDFLALASVVIFHRSELTSCARSRARLIIRRAVVVHLPQNVSPRTAAGITTSSNAGIYDLTKAPRDAFMRRGRKSAHDDSPSLSQERGGIPGRRGKLTRASSHFIRARVSLGRPAGLRSIPVR